MIKKTGTVHARVEPELKNKAESILKSLGFSTSQSIQLFYRQVVFQRGLPFQIHIPLDTVEEQIPETKEGNISKEQKTKELQKDQWENIGDQKE